MNDFEQDVQSLANELFGAATETEESEDVVDTEEVEDDGVESKGTNSNDTTTEESSEESGDEEDNNEQEVTIPKTLPKEKGRQNEAFAQMRVQLREQEKQNKQLTTVLQRLADAKGVDLATLLTSLDEDADKAAAEKQNMDPQMYRRIRQLEEAEQARSQEALQERFSRRLVEFNQEARLSDAELRQFFQEAADNGFDLINSNLNFMHVYRGLYHDKLTAAKEEEIRQAELARQKKAQQSTATVTKKKGAGAAEKTGDMGSILNDIAKSFKMIP